MPAALISVSKAVGRSARNLKNGFLMEVCTKNVQSPSILVRCALNFLRIKAGLQPKWALRAKIDR